MDASSVEIRVLGCLIETTPDQYPLSLNAPRNASNQSTSRDLAALVAVAIQGEPD